MTTESSGPKSGPLPPPAATTGKVPAGMVAAPRILIVDDDEPIQAVLRTALQRGGYVVHIASDGRAALRLFQQQRVDLIVTDLCMPDTDGMEFLMRLREMRSHVPVIVMSGGVGSNRAGLLHAAELMGACRTLAKPFSIEELLATVRAVLTAPAAKPPGPQV